MRARRTVAVSTLAAAAFAWTSLANAEIFQIERAFSCTSSACDIGDLPPVPAEKRLVLRKLSCELYALKQNTTIVRAVFYVFGRKEKNVTPRHRFVAGYFFDGAAGGGVSSFTAGLSETPTLELRAGYSPVIEARGDWQSASGACTLIGDLTRK